MLTKQIDIETLARVYAQNQAIVIRNILDPSVAERIFEVLSAAPWYLEIKDFCQADTLRVPVSKVADRAHLLGVLDSVEHRLDTNRLFFVRLALADTEFGENVLAEFRRYLDSEEFVQVMRKITGKTSINRVWAEATCYEKCCFLGGHRDDHHPDNVVAFVFNLSKEWVLDWGGLLMLSTPNSPPTILPPIFNSLAMFTVPRDHHVSAVSPAATGQRLSVTGWLRSTPQ